MKASARRIAVPLAVLAVAAAGVVALVAIFSDRDDSTFDAGTQGPGLAVAAPTGDLRGLLAPGNVVVEHPEPKPPAALTALQEQVSGEDSAPLRRSGQAVILRQGNARVARAWERELRYRTPQDASLRDFVEFWLGRGSQR